MSGANGSKVTALPHDGLRDVLKKYNRLKEPARKQKEEVRKREDAQPQTADEKGTKTALKVGPVPAEVRQALKLSPFYKKFVSAGGLPVVSSAKVSDAGLREADHHHLPVRFQERPAGPSLQADKLVQFGRHHTSGSEARIEVPGTGRGCRPRR